MAIVVPLAASTWLSPATAQQQPAPLPQSVSELIRVREDVYAFRYLNHVSLFVPTDEGVVVVDPIGGGGNPQAPVALKGAISSITAQPVRWLVYSHSAAEYFLDLMDAVRQARAAGHADNSEETVAAVRSALEPRYGTWVNFQNGLAGNISGVLRWWST